MKKNEKERKKISKKEWTSFSREPYFVPTSLQTEKIRRNLFIYSGAILLLQMNALDFENFHLFEVDVNLSSEKFLVLFILLYLYSFVQYLFLIFDDVQHFRFNAKIIRNLRRSEGTIDRAGQRIDDYQENPLYSYYLFGHTVENWRTEIEKQKEKFKELFEHPHFSMEKHGLASELKQINDSINNLLTKMESTEFDHGRADTIQAFMAYLIFQNWKFSIFNIFVPALSLIPLLYQIYLGFQ